MAKHQTGIQRYQKFMKVFTLIKSNAKAVTHAQFVPGSKIVGIRI